jgi:DNA-binding CsgD family transcriptional regulator
MVNETIKDGKNCQEDDIGIRYQRSIELFEKGLNFYEIADILNISKIHLVRSFPKHVLLERIANLLEQGLSYEKIGNQLGFDSRTIMKYSKESGLHDDHSKQVIEMFKNKFSIREIVKQLNVRPQEVIAKIPHSMEAPNRM